MTTMQLGISAGEPITIDLDTLISTRLLVTASSGGGKSETLRRIIEEAHRHVQVIVIDPEGEFSTLREKYPFVLIGEGGEAPADIRTADAVARKLLELQASAVCDIYEMKPIHNRHVWVQRFIEALVHAPKELWHPVLIVLDEAHIYSPEKGYGESCANDAVMSLASLGRKRGFCLIAATQRLSKLNKNTVEPLQNYVVGQTMYDDQKRAAGIFKIPPGAETRTFCTELERLHPGHFIVRGRAFNRDMARVKITQGQTRPPATGSALAGRVIPAPEAIKHLLPKLAELPHEAEQKEKQEQGTQGEIMRLTQELQEVTRRVNDLEAEADQIRSVLHQAQHIARQLVVVLESPDIEQVMREVITEVRAEAAAGDPEALAMMPMLPPVKPNGADRTLRPGAKRMLAALAQWYPKGRPEGQVAAQARVSRKGGSWTAYKADLTAAGYMEIKDGMMHATRAGVGYAGTGVPPAPKTTDEVVTMWAPRFKAGARRMLTALVNYRGNKITKRQLAALANVSEAGGSFTSYLSELRNAGLVEYDKHGVWANKETLFL